MTPEKRAEIRKRCEADDSHVTWRDGEMCVGNSRIMPLAILGAHSKVDLPLALDALEAAERRVGELEGRARTAEQLNLAWNQQAARTHCGSEFIDDPVRVFDAVIATASANFEVVKDAIRRERATEERIATLEAALAESEAKGAEDAARLDWLEKHPYTAYRNRDPETGHMPNYHCLVDEDRAGSRTGILENSLRAAIDAARKEPK